MTNEELVTCIQNCIDVKGSKQRLCVQNRGIVAKLANRLTGHGEFEDLMQEGYIGLLRAADDYNANKGASFISYAVYWINQSMYRYIENNGTNIRLPSHRRQQVIAYKRFISDYIKEHGVKPSDKDICYVLDITDMQLKSIRYAIEKAEDTSIYEQIGESDELDRLSTIADESSCADFEAVEDRLQNEQLAAVIWAEVDSLKQRQADVLHKYYQGNMTLSDIGEQINVSASRAAQLHQEGLRALRAPKHAKKLKPFALDYIRTKGLRGGGVKSFNTTWTSSTEWVAMKLYEIYGKPMVLNKDEFEKPMFFENTKN